MKNMVTLSEQQLHNIIKNSVKNILSEMDWKTNMNAARGLMNKANMARSNGDEEGYNNYKSKSNKLQDHANKKFNEKHFNGSGYQGSNINRNSSMLRAGLGLKGGELHDERNYGSEYANGMNSSLASRKKIYGFGKDLVGGNGFKTKTSQSTLANDYRDQLSKVDGGYNNKIKSVGDDLNGYYNGKSEYIKGQGWK